MLSRWCHRRIDPEHRPVRRASRLGHATRTSWTWNPSRQLKKSRLSRGSTTTTSSTFNFQIPMMIQTWKKHHLSNFLQFIGKNDQEENVDEQLNEAKQVKEGDRERLDEKPKRRTATTPRRSRTSSSAYVAASST